MNYNMDRDELQYKLRQACYHLFNKDSAFIYCEDVILYVEELFDTYSQSELGNIFNDEFQFGNSTARTAGIPIYLYMELLGGLIDKIDASDLDRDKVNYLKAKFGELREKTKGFSYNKKFNPDKHLAFGVIDHIILAKGNISIGTTIEEGVRYVNVTCIETHEDIYEKNGEYFSKGEPLIVEYKFECLYEEDLKIVREIIERRNSELVDRYKTIAFKYFKNGKLPNRMIEFEDNLIDRKINSNIIFILEKLVMDRKNYSRDSKGELDWMKANDIYLEGILELEQMQEEVKEDMPSTTDDKPKEEIPERPKEQQPVPGSRRSRKEALKEMLKLMKEVLGFDINQEEIENLDKAKKGKK